MFNASTPSGVDPARAEVLVRRAASNIVTGRNDCGRADGISATSGYKSRTTLKPGAARNHADETICISDLKSVVGFRSVGDGFKAATCWWANADAELTEADISFHPSVTWTLADSIPSGCTAALHFESVATHEFGHAFGLNHPGSGHSSLTMQPGAACDNSKVTLGLGDLRGLEEIRTDSGGTSSVKSLLATRQPSAVRTSERKSMYSTPLTGVSTTATATPPRTSSDRSSPPGGWPAAAGATRPRTMSRYSGRVLR